MAIASILMLTQVFQGDIISVMHLTCKKLDENFALGEFWYFSSFFEFFFFFFYRFSHVTAQKNTLAYWAIKLSRILTETSPPKNNGLWQEMHWWLFTGSVFFFFKLTTNPQAPCVRVKTNTNWQTDNQQTGNTNV